MIASLGLALEAGSTTVHSGDLTVIVLGVRRPYPAPFASLAAMRRALPGATFVLSTSRTEALVSGDLSSFDKVLIQDDPGLMAADKFDGGPVDINQARAYAATALAQTSTTMAILLRPGAAVSSVRALDLWFQVARASGKPAARQQRILVSKFFTINPRYDERLPFQIATGFQLGRTEDLAAFWSGPEYDFETGSWYDTREHRPGTLPRERASRARFTPDQWMSLHYLYPDGRLPISCFNDMGEGVLTAYEKALADRFIVVHPLDIDLDDADHRDLYLNTYANMICFSHSEWHRLTGLSDDETAFTTRDFWPRREWHRRMLLLARNRLSEAPLRRSALVSRRLLHQIYG